MPPGTCACSSTSHSGYPGIPGGPCPHSPKPTSGPQLVTSEIHPEDGLYRRAVQPWAALWGRGGVARACTYRLRRPLVCVHKAPCRAGQRQRWERRGPPVPVPPHSSAGSAASENSTGKAGLPGCMKMCLSREENGTYFISHFVSLIYNLQIFRHMVCEPPSVLLLGPTNPCHFCPLSTPNVC